MCEYCGNTSGMVDQRGGCIACGAPIIYVGKRIADAEWRSGLYVDKNTLEYEILQLKQLEHDKKFWGNHQNDL